VAAGRRESPPVEFAWSIAVLLPDRDGGSAGEERLDGDLHGDRARLIASEWL
jgi:hypothetical protein